jgi:translation initiation factor 2 beta subunit (eIF-2beta)/eIF-5
MRILLFGEHYVVCPWPGKLNTEIRRRARRSKTQTKYSSIDWVSMLE